ncbi:MAG: glycosyltransferase [Bacteroidia bacterium]
MLSNQLKASFLAEISWEVCNQQGGIYTVIRSKLPEMVKAFGDNFFLIGPYVDRNIMAEIEEIHTDTDEISKSVQRLRNMGYEVVYGRWLVSGRPKVVLINPDFAFNRMDNIEKALSEGFDIDYSTADELARKMLLFGDVVQTFLTVTNEEVTSKGNSLIAQFHEWMTAPALLQLKMKKSTVKTVFTTHATLLGRYLASNTPNYYDIIDSYDWRQESRNYGIFSQVSLEYQGAKNADIFTTVSSLTSDEFGSLYGLKADVVTPNGLNIRRYLANYEIQNKHIEAKTKIHRFTMGHFFQSYAFDLDKTIYLFSSGRYEYRNKGYDVTLDALKRLNEYMIKENVDRTVVFFMITKKPTWSINPNVLEGRGVMEEIDRTCDQIIKQIKQRLIYKAVGDDEDHRLPELNDLVDDYWKLRYRRTLQNWKGKEWPIIVTHNLKDDVNDEVLNYLRDNRLLNSPLDKVKVVYHPDFIESTNPLFGFDYDEFVRGCHLGVFPSYYEPWGYTPLECIARGVPTVTSDLSGFGNFVTDMDADHEDLGLHVTKRRGEDDEKAAENLAKYLLNFTKGSRRARLEYKTRLEEFSERFDWSNLIGHYIKAYEKSLS